MAGNHRFIYYNVIDLACIGNGKVRFLQVEPSPCRFQTTFCGFKDVRLSRGLAGVAQVLVDEASLPLIA